MLFMLLGVLDLCLCMAAIDVRLLSVRVSAWRVSEHVRLWWRWRWRGSGWFSWRGRVLALMFGCRRSVFVGG